MPNLGTSLGDSIKSGKADVLVDLLKTGCKVICDALDNQPPERVRALLLVGAKFGANYLESKKPEENPLVNVLVGMGAKVEDVAPIVNDIVKGLRASIEADPPKETGPSGS
jgi:hypothetical protein